MDWNLRQLPPLICWSRKRHLSLLLSIRQVFTFTSDLSPLHHLLESKCSCLTSAFWIIRQALHCLVCMGDWSHQEILHCPLNGYHTCVALPRQPRLLSNCCFKIIINSNLIESSYNVRWAATMVTALQGQQRLSFICCLKCKLAREHSGWVLRNHVGG